MKIMYKQRSNYKMRNGWTVLPKIEKDGSCAFGMRIILNVFQVSFVWFLMFDIMLRRHICLTQHKAVILSFIHAIPQVLERIRTLGQYIKAEVWDFPVMTERARLISYLLYRLFIIDLSLRSIKTNNWPGDNVKKHVTSMSCTLELIQSGDTGQRLPFLTAVNWP